MAKLKITLVRSLIGRNEKQRATVAALGLRKLQQTVVKEDNPAIRGMINRVSHMVKVEEVQG
jgi:large subunit ribosomal protein L30